MTLWRFEFPKTTSSNFNCWRRPSYVMEPFRNTIFKWERLGIYYRHIAYAFSTIPLYFWLELSHKSRFWRCWQPSKDDLYDFQSIIRCINNTPHTPSHLSKGTSDLKQNLIKKGPVFNCVSFMLSLVVRWVPIGLKPL